MNSTAARSADTLGRTPARSLPAWVYDHPEMTRLEYERILKPSWQIACLLIEPIMGNCLGIAAEPDYVRPASTEIG